jgi:hypothetical protein
MAKSPFSLDDFAEMMFAATERADTQRQATFVALLSIVDLLMEAELFTPEQLLERLDAVQKLLPEQFQGDAVDEQLLGLRAVLRQKLDHKQLWQPEIVQSEPEKKD